jgi:hypothetical protein
MRRELVWVIGGAILGVLVLTVLAVGPMWPPGMRGEAGRYRIATEIAVAAGDREIRNTVEAECVITRGGDVSTGRQTGVHQVGDDPFVLLPDRSLLVLSSHFNPCGRWAEGESFDYVWQMPAAGAQPDLRIVPLDHALFYDSADDPTTVSLLVLSELFRGGVNGWRIKEMKHSPAPDSKTELPYRLEETFVGLHQVPWARLGTPLYGVRFHLTNFQGFRMKVVQLRAPCEGLDPQAEGAVMVPLNKPCAPFGDTLGWLVGQPNADFSELTHAMRNLSPVRVATLYRETKLREIAPGKRRSVAFITAESNEVSYFYWTPRLCFDGFCFKPEPSEFGLWPKYQLYYPKQNRLVTVEPEGVQAANSIRRRDDDAKR